MTSWTMPGGRSLVWRPATLRSCAASTKTMPRANGDAVGADDVDGVALAEAPGDVDDAGRQQAGLALDERPARPVVDGDRAGDAGGEGDPQLAGRQLAAVGLEAACRPARRRPPRRARRGGAALAITVRTPDHEAMRAASSLLAMPPLPRPLPPRAGADRQQRVVGADRGRRARRRGRPAGRPCTARRGR